MSSVSVRTLHHYEAVGLVVPQTRTAAGYRQYGDADLARLRDVLTYREPRLHPRAGGAGARRHRPAGPAARAACGWCASASPTCTTSGPIWSG
ncbi:hypothetical protein GCM10025868_07730 [Angustibacter aerolatus]|uniref:HTH merR-type domain-containing protein n=1 Tax=Angustibacter aerolatus TaxID=1162965 RepID=A0ABQ6JBI4_9ACTN|nr:hypothetical protein GCM10025868_07730 [Angustibacter aerolatus]